MSSVLNDNFIRSVTKRVEDCSNPMQLREYFNRYKNYVFTPEIQNVFLERVKFFQEYYRMDSLFEAQCDDLEDELRTEIMIAKVVKPEDSYIQLEDNHYKKLRSIENNINLLWVKDDCLAECEKELDLFRQVFQMTNGNKVDICRILDIDNQFLNDKIDQYKLKDELNEIRREYRNSCKNKD